MLVYKMSVYDRQLANKAYFSDITVASISQSFAHKMATKASWRRNYVTVTLCIDVYACNFFLQVVTGSDVNAATFPASHQVTELD